MLTALVPAGAGAAWLGYRNDTAAAIIIQTSDVVVVGGKVQTRSGKPHVLYPGEVAWDSIAAPGPRIVEVYEKQTNRKVLQERVDCNNKNDIFVSLRFIVLPTIKGQPPQPPVLKLIPTIPPQTPKGASPPGSTPGHPGPGGPAPGSPPTPPGGTRSPGH
jgi:hypothetical protein